MGRPSGLGINTGAFLRPPERRISQTVAKKEKNDGGSLASSRSMCGTAVTAKAVRPFLFLCIPGTRQSAVGSRHCPPPIAHCLVPTPYSLPQNRVRMVTSARLHVQYEERILDTVTGL